MTDKLDDKRTGASPAGQRGPAEHERREQILAAADEHFRRYGYNKTTVADLASAIGLSTAYIYKFFDSKQAIGEAICAMCLGRIVAELRNVARERKSAADRLSRLYRSLARQGTQMFFNERKLHDLAATACSEKWQLVEDYEAALLDIVRGVVAAGRDAGEFERTTPIDEVCRAIVQTMKPFSHPIILEQNLDELDERVALMANLVLRSLSPRL
jgi:AcrR family transcriptional regulator